MSHHGQGAYWEKLVTGFADPSYSRFDATMETALLDAIVQSCLDPQLNLTQLQEFPHSIREVDYDIYDGQKAQMPMSFLLCATKP